MLTTLLTVVSNCCDNSPELMILIAFMDICAFYVYSCFNGCVFGVYVKFCFYKGFAHEFLF